MMGACNPQHALSADTTTASANSFALRLTLATRLGVAFPAPPQRFEELGKSKQGLRLVLQEALRDSRFREKDGEYMLRKRCWE